MKIKVLFAVALLATGIAAHFLPFERASIAPDDYASLVRLSGTDASAGDERPLNRIFLQAQSAAAKDNAAAGFALLLLSDAFLLIAVYMLMGGLLKDPSAAILASMLFCVMPNTLEIYQSAIFANIAFVSGIYVLCLYCFLRYIDGANLWLLVSSAVLYLAGIFWYETGFFTPLIAAVAAFGVKGGRKYSWLVFIPLMAVYAVYRFTALPCAAGAQAHTVSAAIVPFNLLETVQHYAGRYMARSVVYGFYRFAAMGFPLIVLCSASALAAGYFMIKVSGGYDPGRLERRQIMVSCAMAVFWLLPILLNSNGGVGGRHLLLPSVGLSVLGIAILGLSGRFKKAAAGSVFILLMVISQGNAWSQAVACRINATVYGYLTESSATIRDAECVVIDTKSFADNIPFSLVKSDYNVLNTYYGAQAFEDWGLKSMVKLASGQRDKKVYVAITRPERSPEGTWFDIGEYRGYRSVEPLRIEVKEECYIVEYAKVYDKGFRDGLNAE